MNTPPPILAIPGTEEPPSGQHGPHSGIHPAEQAHPKPQVDTHTEDVAPVDPTAHLDIAALVELPCAAADCTSTLPVNAAHVDNLDGWLCRRHKDVTA